MITGIVAFLAVAVGIALLVKGLYPADLPESQSPDFVDNIFDNRGVLWAARLLLVSAAGILALGGIFIATSIGIRMRNGEWLRRAGPFEISEAGLNGMTGEADFWHRAALANQAEISDLEYRLQQSDELIRDLRKRS